MSSGLSTAVHNSALDHLLGTATWTAPSDIYVALFDGDPESGGSELSGNSYARVQHNNWNGATGGEATNDGSVTFPTASGAWSEADYVALYDASTTGNRLGSGPLDTPKTAGSGDTLVFNDESLTVKISRTA